ncbi:MAG: hypothetical protein WEB02_03855 [Methylophaga sp.]
MKEVKTMTSSTARDLYARFHQLNSESEELPEIAREKREKVEKLLGYCFPWSYWYELPYKQSLGIFLLLAGLESLIMEASKSDNPSKTILDYLDTDPDPLNEAELSDEEKSVFISLFMSILHQLRSLSIFSLPLSDLVEKAKTDDDALLNAVVVDRSVVSCPAIAQRIQYAQLSDDESFLNKLAKAITRTRPRRPESKYDDLRFMLEALDEMKEYENTTQQEKFELLAVDLELFDTEGNKDSFEAFKKLLRRRNIRKGT